MNDQTTLREKLEERRGRAVVIVPGWMLNTLSGGIG